jgi:hypothetical protein
MSVTCSAGALDTVVSRLLAVSVQHFAGRRLSYDLAPHLQYRSSSLTLIRRNRMLHDKHAPHNQQKPARTSDPREKTLSPDMDLPTTTDPSPDPMRTNDASQPPK